MRFQSEAAALDLNDGDRALETRSYNLSAKRSQLMARLEVVAASQETQMPRYYFHITQNAAENVPLMVDLPDIESAKKEAQRLAGNLLHDVSTDIWSDDMAVRLVDENNLFVGIIDVAGQLSPAYKR